MAWKRLALGCLFAVSACGTSQSQTISQAQKRSLITEIPNPKGVGIPWKVATARAEWVSDRIEIAQHPLYPPNTIKYRIDFPELPAVSQLFLSKLHLVKGGKADAEDFILKVAGLPANLQSRDGVLLNINWYEDPYNNTESQIGITGETDFLKSGIPMVSELTHTFSGQKLAYDVVARVDIWHPNDDGTFTVIMGKAASASIVLK